MRIKREGQTTKLWLSKHDTLRWATRPHDQWPNSTIAGRRLYAEFNGKDLVDYRLDGRQPFKFVGQFVTEFNAIVADHLSDLSI